MDKSKSSYLNKVKPVVRMKVKPVFVLEGSETICSGEVGVEFSVVFYFGSTEIISLRC